jgi:hypothetical protein
MLTLLHYLPHIIFAGLVLLALAVMFGDSGARKRVEPQRIRQQHYTWSDHNPRRG